MQTKDHVLQELRAMFRRALAMSATGGNHAQLSHARGHVDGYMRALLDVGVVTRTELLGLVGAERERANGPAVRTLEPSQVDEGAAA